MFRARIFTLVGVVAAVALSVSPADADQRGGRRDGGSGQPQATPPPDAGRHAVPRPVDGGPPPGGAGRDVVVMTPGVGAQHRRPPYGYPGPVYGTYRHPVYNSFRGPFYGPYPGPVYARRTATRIRTTGSGRTRLSASASTQGSRSRSRVSPTEVSLLTTAARTGIPRPTRFRIRCPTPPLTRQPATPPITPPGIPRLVARGRRPRRAASRWCRGPRLPGRWPTEASASR